MSVEREATHDWLDERPPRERPTPAEVQPSWPTCRRCGEPAEPGKTCDRSRCPWQREGGEIVRMEVG